MKKATDLLWDRLEQAETNLHPLEYQVLLADAVLTLASDEEVDDESIGMSGDIAFALEIALNRMCDSEEKLRLLSHLLDEELECDEDEEGEEGDDDCCGGNCHCDCNP